MQPDREATRKRIGAAIARQRGQRTQVWLGHEAGLHPQTISEIERGVVGTSVETLLQIAAALGVDVKALLSADAEEVRS